MTAKKTSKKLSQLSRGRPPTLRAGRPALSAKATRNLIRSHHRLLKARTQALEAGDEDLVRSLDSQIQANGGLESYQLASKIGQSLERGGDTSKLLIDWINPRLRELNGTPFKLRVLEVGALSTKNACSLNQFLDVTRIDLHSQEPGIQQQDFMERPLPSSDDDRFHLISLSLVLNYVPSATGRGEMLKRCVKFLTDAFPSESPLVGFKPLLFLVLPAACVTNSRYLTEERLQQIMFSIGFSLVRSKTTSKLIYQLWEYVTVPERRPFKKDLINPGKTRNNFAILLNDSPSASAET
jgi:25S rRNA (adenine2142-N1)-methyltransferase